MSAEGVNCSMARLASCVCGNVVSADDDLSSSCVKGLLANSLTLVESDCDVINNCCSP